MALIRCPECGKEVSDQAPACIHCGYPLSPAADENPQSPPEAPNVPPPPSPPSAEDTGGMGFGGTVLAVIVGVIVAALILSLL